MRFRAPRIAASLLVAAMIAGGVLAQSSSDDGGRKIKTKTSPTYPDLARRMNVSGKVKIELTITPDGRVRSTRVIGGHPLLVQACQDSVKEWRYMPGPEETTQVIECDFHGTN